MMADEEEEETLFDVSLNTQLLDPSRVATVKESNSSRAKLLSTACLCAGFFGLGLCIAIPGPTLLDLQQRTQTNKEQITWIFTGRSVGYLMGSILGGFLFDRFNGNLLLSISMFLTSVATGILPWSKDFRLLVVLVGFQGLSMGSLDTGGNVMCVNTWGKNSGPYMQALHFSFGLGAFVAPFVAEPFLTPTTNLTSIYDVHNSSDTNLDIGVHRHLAVASLSRNKRDVDMNPHTNMNITVNNTTATSPKPKKPAAADGTNHESADGGILDKINDDKPQDGLPSDSKTTTLPPMNNGSYSTNVTLLTSKISSPTMTTTTTTTATTTTTVKTPPTLAPVIVNNSVFNETQNANGTYVSDQDAGDSTMKKIMNPIAEIGKALNNIDKVQFAYLTVSILLLVISIAFMIACCCGQRTLVSMKNQELGKEYIRKEPLGFRVQIMILLFFFYFLYVGIEVTFGALIMSFAVDELKWSKVSGILLTSMFWGAFATGRGLAIFFAKCLRPNIMLVVDLFLSFCAISGMVLSLDHKQELFMWFCTAVFGIGLASIFPTGITWAERYMKITGKSTAVFVVGSALGEMAIPAVAGSLYQIKGPRWLLYICMAAILISIVIYIIMQNMAFNKGERYESFESLDRDRTPLINMASTTEQEDSGDDNAAESSAAQLLSNKKKRVTFNLTNETTKKKKVPTATLC